MRTTFAKVSLLIGLMMTLGFGTAGIAFAGDGDVCPGGDSGKIDVSGSHTSVTVTAPEGYLIAGYCVKAGSVEGGTGGPVFVTVNPPSASVTITYPSGKDISHYSLTFVPVVEESPTPTVSVTPTPSETVTPTPTVSVTPTPSVSVTPSESPSPSVTPSFPTPTPFAFEDTVVPPTCEEAGALLIDAFPGVSITVEPAFDGPGTYTLTATLDDPVNTEWEDGTNEPKTREVTVLGATGFQSEDPEAPCFLATTTPTPTDTSTSSVPPTATVTTTPPLGSGPTPVTIVPVSNPGGYLAQTGAEALLPLAGLGAALTLAGAAALMLGRKRQH